jgi:predicted nucleic acid-binding protein
VDFVLDASIAMAWCFVDEKTPHTEKLLDSLEIGTAFVPSLWSLEVGNILVCAERRKRITYADITQFLELIGQLNIQTDHETSNKRGFHEVISLAYSKGLTTYDAAYLELAMRKGLSLASKDRQLCDIASKLGVKVLSA